LTSLAAASSPPTTVTTCRRPLPISRPLYVTAVQGLLGPLRRHAALASYSRHSARIIGRVGCLQVPACLPAFAPRGAWQRESLGSRRLDVPTRHRARHRACPVPLACLEQSGPAYWPAAESKQHGSSGLDPSGATSMTRPPAGSFPHRQPTTIMFLYKMSMRASSPQASSSSRAKPAQTSQEDSLLSDDMHGVCGRPRCAVHHAGV